MTRSIASPDYTIRQEFVLWTENKELADPSFTRERPWQNGIDFLEAKSLLTYFKARKIGHWRGLALDLGDLFNNPTAYPASALFLFLYFYGRDYPEVDPKKICEII